MRKKLSKKDVLHLANLAKLVLSESDIERITPQLSETLEYVENLNEIDTSGFFEHYTPSQRENVFFLDGKKNERLLSQHEATANAKQTENGFFVAKNFNKSE